jgi:hypothetical protein
VHYVNNLIEAGQECASIANIDHANGSHLGYAHNTSARALDFLTVCSTIGGIRLRQAPRQAAVDALEVNISK